MRTIQLTILIIALAGMAVLAGCESVPMPDMSNFNLDILKEKPVVSIKSGYSKVNIRPTPSTEQPPVATLKGGDRLTLDEESGNWLKVTFYDTTGDKQEGWVYKYLVEGYNKPDKAGVGSSVASGMDEAEDNPEAETLEVEQDMSEKKLPKSETISPL